MEDRISRRAALKVLAASAVLGCSAEGDGDTGPLAPIVESGEDTDTDGPSEGSTSYLATEQLQDIHGAPAAGNTPHGFRPCESISKPTLLFVQLPLTGNTTGQ